MIEILEYCISPAVIAVIFYGLFFSNKSSVKVVKEKQGTIEKPKKVKVQKTISEVKPEKTVSWTERLAKGLSQTRTDVWGKVGSIFNKSDLSDEDLEEIEEILYGADLSPHMVEELFERLKKEYKAQSGISVNKLVRNYIEEKMSDIQAKVNTDIYTFDKSDQDLKVIMIVGVNGAGKTTTIGKLATKLRSQGAKVVVGACDTFRAAAVEQLEVWCKRADVEIIKAAEGANPSGVAFDAVEYAQNNNANYCIIDTAGRLHTASNLMDELTKTKKVMSKVLSSAPHETLLVIDAITGQNALKQAQEFNNSLELSGIVLTKCDGSSKAGSAVSIVDALKVPVTYIGVGENVEDLNIFALNEYLDALLGDK